MQDTFTLSDHYRPSHATQHYAALQPQPQMKAQL
jgi:hypothetical protein